MAVPFTTAEQSVHILL